MDLLVLVRAARFTGFGSSTMSWVVQEYRRGLHMMNTTVSLLL